MRFPRFDRQPSLSEYLSGRKGFAFPTSELPEIGEWAHLTQGWYTLNIYRESSPSRRSIYGYKGQEDYEWPEGFDWSVEPSVAAPSAIMQSLGRFDVNGNTTAIWSKAKNSWVDNPDYDHTKTFFERYDRETLLKVLAAFDGGAGLVLPHAVPGRVAPPSSGPFRGI